MWIIQLWLQIVGSMEEGEIGGSEGCRIYGMPYRKREGRLYGRWGGMLASYFLSFIFACLLLTCLLSTS